MARPNSHTMTDVAGLIDELSDLVGDEFIQTSAALDAYRVDGSTPWAVVFPGDVEQVAALLTLAQREELAVIPWGGGTMMGMGYPPERLDIVLCLQRLNRVLEHEPADLTATVQAGITMAALQNQLGNRGQWWPVEPPLAEQATLGGVLAANASGPKRLLYGTARDLLIGIKVVQADGVIAKAGGKVTKNVTGYDMMKLYIGSLGTLAVIVEATLKLRPLPQLQHVAWSTFPSADVADNAARRLLTGGLLPNALELLNPSLTRRLCEAFEPRPGAEGWSLVVGVDGSEPAVVRQLRDIESLARGEGATAWHTQVDDGRLWHAIQRRFRGRGSAREERLIVRVGTLRTQVTRIMRHLTELEARLGAPVELTGRFGNGLVYGHITLNSAAEQSAHVAQALAEMRGQLATQRGYVVVESASPAFKARFDCWGDVGPQAEVMAALKHEFDPRRVLNPGRFVHHL
jgi:glycolate oxidase FAD binding subunit